MARPQLDLHPTYNPQPDTLHTPTWRLTCENDFSQSIIIHSSQAVLASMLSVPPAVKDKIQEIGGGLGSSFGYQLAVEYTIYPFTGDPESTVTGTHDLSAVNFIDLLPEEASATGVTVTVRMYLKSTDDKDDATRRKELRRVLGNLPPISIFWQLQS